MNWRHSKLFVYGWLPIRAAAMVVVTLLTLAYSAAHFLIWLHPDDVKRAFRRGCSLD